MQSLAVLQAKNKEARSLSAPTDQYHCNTFSKGYTETH